MISPYFGIALQRRLVSIEHRITIRQAKDIIANPNSPKDLLLKAQEKINRLNKKRNDKPRK